MTDRQDNLREDAIGWAIRLNERDFDDWAGFAAWLEADPAHARAYDAIAAAAEHADEVLRLPPVRIAPPAPEGRPARWRRQAGGGLVAAMLVGAVGWGMASFLPARSAIETRPGEARTVTIGTATIALNGGTRLMLDRHDPHRATLERGEALFDVRHDEAHPFTVRVGDSEIRDIGTRFDVTRDGDAIRVAVAEGTVLYNPGREALRLDAGDALATTDSSPRLGITPVVTTDVGGWREHRLSYRQASLATVAADLSRGLGVTIVAAPDVAAQRFTGAIAYGGDKARFLADLGPLLDADVKHDHDRWLLTRKADTRH